jgi:phage/plasmid-like protein (TIGR03299 family)
LATSASFTTVRIVCDNTLQMALRATGSSAIRVTHRSEFDHDAVKAELGLVDETFDDFMTVADKLASRRVTQRETEDFYGNLFSKPYAEAANEKERIESISQGVLAKVLDVHNRFPGQQTKSANGTAWGLVNGVTAYLDHVRNTRTADARLDYAWFGQGKSIKTQAMLAAEKLL